jgi:hypothetical protein
MIVSCGWVVSMDYGVACCFNWNFYDGFDWWGMGGDDLVCWGMVAW